MKTIQLTGGYCAIVDDEDFAFLNLWKWQTYKHNNTMYAVRSMSLNKKSITVYMHRIVNQTPKGFDTDHINGNGLDNRKANLRSTTHHQNCLNKPLSAKNTSGYRGVTWNKNNNKWHAKIKHKGKAIFIGYYDSITDAAAAFNAKDKELRGGQFRERATKDVINKQYAVV